MEGDRIVLEKVSAGYGKNEILHKVSLRAQSGQVTTLVGPNGSGKSTLLRALLGMIPLWGGDIRVDGISISRLRRAELARRIAYLPQGKNVPDITVGRMVLHGRFPYLSYPRRYRGQDLSIAEEAMGQMGILEFAERPVGELSGGMRQKAYLAMALAQQAPAIVMDEPTTYLDIGQQMKFARMAGRLAEDGKAVILVLHDLLLALRISHRIAAMRGGEIVGCGTAEEILASGVLEKLYGVRVGTVRTKAGPQYFYEGL